MSSILLAVADALAADLTAHSFSLIVIIECGPANAEGIRRLVADDTEIVVSVLEPDEEIAAATEELKAGGYDHVMLVTPADHRSPNAPVPGRSAA
jgi:hypothetical protein